LLYKTICSSSSKTSRRSIPACRQSEFRYMLHDVWYDDAWCMMLLCVICGASCMMWWCDDAMKYGVKWHDVWCEMYDVWCMAIMYGVWCMICSAWCIMYDVWCVTCHVIMYDECCMMYHLWCIMYDVWSRMYHLPCTM
jgi:hypothetical protein